MKRKCESSLLFIMHNITLLCFIIVCVNASSFVIKNKSRLEKFKNQRPLLHHLHRPRHNHRPARENKLTVCDTCHMNRYDTPFYCPIDPDLPQCIFPVCPKICDDVGGDPSARPKLAPPSPPKRAPFPHPVNLPRIPKNLIDEFTPVSPLPSTVAMPQGRSMGVILQPEKITPYNKRTCEFPSPNLRRIRPGSKYIEYRPSNLSYQVTDILEIASKYGLVPAEFRHPMEWYSVEKSSLTETVSTYKMTAQQPRFFYVVGLSDENGEAEEPGKFLYKSNKTNPTFAVFDPRIYGRTDERCGVLSHVLGSDKRQYLTTRFWNCQKYMADGIRVAHGLFMFPPGDVCNTRSEEECARLEQEKAGGDAKYHNTIQIGQTLTRFIYLYTDQRSWEDAFKVCKAKGMQMLDLDSKWGDALRVAEVIEHFLREAKLNPVTTFWTSGRFGNAYSDGRFTWTTTNAVFENKYSEEAPPFAYSWWDDQKVAPEESELSRRGIMKQPCVSIAINPETGGERPKLNFKAWYCDFPMYVLCYRGLNGTMELDNPIPKPTTAKRTPPRNDSCEKPPEAGSGAGQEEIIDPFNEITCTSKSLTVKRLTPNSKFVDYQPLESSYSVEQVKDQCKKYGLLPAEIRSREDWETIEKSGIGGVISGGEGSSTDYFYVIGMDDSKEEGKIRYENDDEQLSFSLFTAEGQSDKNDRCSMLSSVAVPGDTSRGLAMLHVNCKEGLESDQKIAYGLCMFPPSWKCFKESAEETAAASDTTKFTTIISLGVTDTRSIFFNPVQRDWEDALNFSKAANLSLLDFDPKWADSFQVMTIIKEKLVKDGGFFQLTPFWTSGKLTGLYKDGIGQWETTNESLIVAENPNYKWTRLNHPHLSQLREGIIENGCIEATFDNAKQLVKLRPHYCDMPKYYLMYRVSKRRQDPVGRNTLGITIIETGPREAAAKQGTARRPNKIPSLLVKTTSKKVDKNDTASLNETIRQTRNTVLSKEVDIGDVVAVTDVVVGSSNYDSMVDSQEDSSNEDGGSSSKDKDTEEEDEDLLQPIKVHKQTAAAINKVNFLNSEEEEEDSEENVSG